MVSDEIRVAVCGIRIIEKDKKKRLLGVSEWPPNKNDIKQITLG